MLATVKITVPLPSVLAASGQVTYLLSRINQKQRRNPCISVGHWIKSILSSPRRFLVLNAEWETRLFSVTTICINGVVVGSMDSKSGCLDLHIGSTSIT